MSDVVGVRIQIFADVTFNDDLVWKRAVENHDEDGIPQPRQKGGRGWQDYLYEMPTQGDVAAHIAYNYLVHNRTLSRLDGWADMDDSAVTVTEIDSSAEEY